MTANELDNGAALVRVNRAIFFLSTGRCGTQWLAKHLSQNYADVALVEHEPLHAEYRSRDLLAASELTDQASAARIRQHIARIETVLESCTYIETGGPSWGAMPMLARHFAGRISVVHLTRHPIPTACSLVSHGTYVPPILPGVPERVPVTPFDAGARLPEYRSIWNDLGPYQRSLYFWAEVQSLGLELEAEAKLPWLRLSFDDLRSADGLSRMLEFLELPPTEAVFHAAHDIEDRFSYVTDQWWDISSAQRLPRVSEIAAGLGYDLAEVDELALRRRYLGR